MVTSKSRLKFTKAAKWNSLDTQAMTAMFTGSRANSNGETDVLRCYSAKPCLSDGFITDRQESCKALGKFSIAIKA